VQGWESGEASQESSHPLIDASKPLQFPFSKLTNLSLTPSFRLPGGIWRGSSGKSGQGNSNKKNLLRVCWPASRKLFSSRP